MLFSNQRSHRIQIPAKDSSEQPANVGFLVRHLCENLMKDKRKDLFVLEDRMWGSFRRCRDNDSSHLHG